MSVGQIERQKGRQVNRQTCRQVHRQTGRQADTRTQPSSNVGLVGQGSMIQDTNADKET
jgi:hypothetical protein